MRRGSLTEKRENISPLPLPLLCALTSFPSPSFSSSCGSRSQQMSVIYQSALSLSPHASVRVTYTHTRAQFRRKKKKLGCSRDAGNGRVHVLYCTLHNIHENKNILLVVLSPNWCPRIIDRFAESTKKRREWISNF